MTPLTHPAKKNSPGGQWDQGPWVVLHVQEEVYQSNLTLKRRIAGDQERFWFVSLSHPGSVLAQTYSRTKYQSLGLTLLNARSSLFYYCWNKWNSWRKRFHIYYTNYYNYIFCTWAWWGILFGSVRIWGCYNVCVCLWCKSLSKALLLDLSLSSLS